MERERFQASELTLRCRGCSTPVPLAWGVPDGPVSCPSCGEAYECDQGIVVLGRDGSQQDYPDEIYDFLVDIEPRHFWFSSRNDVILATLRQAIGDLRERSVLDIGCGTGFVLQALETAGMKTCGLDMHLSGLRHARRRTHGAIICTNSSQLPFASKFDVVALCDVIEHVDDDVALLRAASAALAPNGALVVTVPALPQLWTAMDSASGHKRRYTKASLMKAFEDAAIRPLVVRYYSTLLLPFQFLHRLMVAASSPDDPRLVLERGLGVPHPAVNAAFRMLTAVDRHFIRLTAPWGGSLIAICS